MRPSISMACILKNEGHNIGALLQSVRGCFDEIIMVDTGSTDNSIEFLEAINHHIQEGQPNWSGLPEIKIYHFDWINDFSAARNFSFSKCTKDYIFWADLDDSLSDAKAFIRWRDNVMHSAHFWLATYNYATNEKGQVICKFIRERVIKRNFGFSWEYFVHEGLIQKEGKKYWPNHVNSWTVNHRRSKEDADQDHMRNLKIFEARPYETLPPRMKFYYGKELVENGMPEKGGKPLMEAIQSGQLDIHDMLLSVQNAAQSAIATKAYPQALDVLMNGLRLQPSRAEFWCMVGDSYIAIGAINEAVHAYEFASSCKLNNLGGTVVCYEHAYWEYPHSQLSNIAMQAGDYKKAAHHANLLKEKGFEIGEKFLTEIARLNDLNTVSSNLTKVSDIIITCPPGMPVTDWDENTLQAKGHGGSETAAIEVAKILARKTGRKVKLFQPRVKRDTMESGVEYLPCSDLAGYVRNIEPHAHIAWRHSVRLTNAKSYVWCHDLQCPGAQAVQNYDKIVALSGFHKEYLIETNGVPEDKIVLGFNGITPEEFEFEAEKDPLKVIFSSSPDRGLIQAIDIVKKAREISGLDLKLHCFYGFDNMRKSGQGDWADKIEKHITDNPFVIYHGFVNKKTLYKHFKESSVWLYVNDFIESYCLTAIEALSCGTWPIVRDMGSLKYTMKEALDKGMCDFMSVEVVDEASTGIWANTLIEAVLDKKYKSVQIDPKNYSWEKVADLFIKEMSL